MKIIKLTGLIVLVPAFLLSCSKTEKYTYTRFMMDTLFQITLYSNLPSGTVEQKVDEAFEIIKGVEQKFSATLSNSVIYRINKDGEIFPDVETRAVFESAYFYSSLTGGAFDATIMPIMKLWGFHERDYRVPSHNEIKQILPRIGYQNISIGKTIKLKNGAKFDPGGFMKGYAVDLATEYLKETGISAGIVNAGGNLRIFGKKPDNTQWAIGVRHPRDASQIIEIVFITNESAISTSGDYERNFERDGRLYHHIMSPSTGYPVDNGIVSVSAISPTAEGADVFSTAIFVMGVDKGIGYANSREIPALIIVKSNDTLVKVYSDYWNRDNDR
jgi:thiamine biosynthesis lipoprotein